jgi:hypothetical protein
MKGDDIVEVVKKYAAPFFQSGDTIFISEKIVAISQGRAWSIKDIHPSFMAKLLVKFVHKSAHSIGSRQPVDDGTRHPRSGPSKNVDSGIGLRGHQTIRHEGCLL